MPNPTPTEDAPAPESHAQSPTSQDAPSSREPSLKPAPKAIRSRLKIEKQVELLEICTRWIRQYVPDKNGGKVFWDKVHEVFESAGSKYSADSCKAFVQSRMHVYDQRAPMEKELEGPLRAWNLAVDRRKEEEKQEKIDAQKTKKEKADKRKADREKADRNKAEKKKSDMEKAAKPVAPERPKYEAGPGKIPREASQTTIPDSQEDLDKSKGDNSVPSIESDPLRKLSDISPAGEPSLKRPRTRSFTVQTEGHPARVKGKTRATSLQPGPTHRVPSAPPRSGAKPEPKPTVTVPLSTTGGKRKRPAPKTSVDDAPEPSTQPKKKAKTSNDSLEKLANGLEAQLTRIEENIGGKFKEVNQELQRVQSEITVLNEWHIQLNDAINHERGISIKQSAVEVSKTSKNVVTEQSASSDESKSMDENGAEIIEDGVPSTQFAGLETIEEDTETSILREKQAPYRGSHPRLDAATPVTSGDDPLSPSSDEDEVENELTHVKTLGRHA